MNSQELKHNPHCNPANPERNTIAADCFCQFVATQELYVGEDHMVLARDRAGTAVLLLNNVPFMAL